MHLRILSLDLDGTLARDGVVEEATWSALRAAKASGFVLFLVTGRRLSVIPDIGPFDELCEAIVAENGAVIFYPRTERVDTPFGKLAPEVIRKLEVMPIDVDFGVAIAATWVPNDRQVLDALAQTGYAATVEYNKGAVMVLPPGATKGSGLKVALEELGYSTRNVLACGDAENDRSMFEQADFSVAVANAIPAMRNLADVVLDKSHGAGVRDLLSNLINGQMPPYRCRPDRRVHLGRGEHDELMCLSSFNFLNSNWAVAGGSGTGKTWLAGLILEQLLTLGYQACVIDPEGDYRSLKAFPRTIVFGDESTPPPTVTDVITLLEYARISLVLDLCLYSPDEKRDYVTRFLQALGGLRAKRGLPHWFLIDEAHFFCHDNGHLLNELILENAHAGGFTFVSYHMSGLPASLLAQIDHWMITPMREPQELANLQFMLTKRRLSSEALTTLSGKQFLLSMGTTAQIDPPESGVVRLDQVGRKLPHVRHLHKYLIAPLSANRQFYFHAQSGEQHIRPAASLWEFSQVLPRLSAKTLRYHLSRKDFERWLRDVIRDEELARQIRILEHREMPDEVLKQNLCDAVNQRFSDLESLI